MRLQVGVGLASAGLVCSGQQFAGDCCCWACAEAALWLTAEPEQLMTQDPGAAMAVMLKGLMDAVLL